MRLGMRIRGREVDEGNLGNPIVDGPRLPF